MGLFNVFYCYLSSIFEFFTFRTKPSSYIQLTDLESPTEDEIKLYCRFVVPQ